MMILVICVKEHPSADASLPPRYINVSTYIIFERFVFCGKENKYLRHVASSHGHHICVTREATHLKRGCHVRVIFRQSVEHYQLLQNVLSKYNLSVCS